MNIEKQQNKLKIELKKEIKGLKGLDRVAKAYDFLSNKKLFICQFSTVANEYFQYLAESSERTASKHIIENMLYTSQNNQRD